MTRSRSGSHFSPIEAGRSGRVPLPALLGGGTVALAVVVLGLVAAGLLPSVSPGPGTSPYSPLAPALDCNPGGAPAPSSIYITTSEPAVNLSAGGELSGVMEFSVVNYTPADLGVSVYFPTVYFTFPLGPSGASSFSMTIVPQNLTISGAGWTNGAHTNRSETVTTGLAFVKGGKDRVTTQKVAIQANVPYGQLTLEFRWMWKATEPNGTSYASPWTIPKATYTKGSVNLPSIFFPAQYITFLSGAGNGAKVSIGTAYSASLGGPVGGRYFFLEMEDGAGKVVQSEGTTIASNASTGNVTIPVLNYDHYLPPGMYLVHIHDACGAILYNKLIDAVFPPTATITFYLQPGSCGPMTFNGTSFANGTSGTFVPSTVPYHFSVPKCSGFEFKNWTDTGALHISANDELMVSNSGTFTIEFKPG